MSIMGLKAVVKTINVAPALMNAIKERIS